MKKRASEKAQPVIQYSYSTRLDARQRELIDEAARLTDSSTAELIRDASVKRAADVVNASGENKSALQVLAREVARFIKRPAISVTWQDLDMGYDGAGTHVTRVDSGIFNEAMLEDGDSGHSRITHVEVCKPEESVLALLGEALATCDTEFVQMLLEQLKAVDAESGSYKAKVSAVDLLRGQEDKADKQ